LTEGHKVISTRITHISSSLSVQLDRRYLRVIPPNDCDFFDKTCRESHTFRKCVNKILPVCSTIFVRLIRYSRFPHNLLSDEFRKIRHSGSHTLRRCVNKILFLHSTSTVTFGVQDKGIILSKSCDFPENWKRKIRTLPMRNLNYI